MIVVDLGWFSGDEESRFSECEELKRQFLITLLIKVEAKLRSTNELSLTDFSSNEALIIPELCLELRHRFQPDSWEEDLMRKALQCLTVGHKLTRSMSDFLIDCFESGEHSITVRLFEECNAFEALWTYLHSPNMAIEDDERERAHLILTHFYTAAAQAPIEVASRIFNADFERLRQLRVFPDVVQRVYQLLQSHWFTISHGLMSLRSRPFHSPVAPSHFSPESFRNDVLMDNFRSILNLHEKNNERHLWETIFEKISNINKGSPPPCDMRAQFTTTFEFMEHVKKLLGLGGSSYELYVSIGPGDRFPVRM